MLASDISVDKNNAVPVYYQIMKQMQDAIARGDLPIGEMIPSEREFCKVLDISRNTIRQAVNILINDGLLYKKKGIGTFVAQQKNKMSQPITTLNSFTEYVESLNMAPSSKVIEMSIVQPPYDVSKALGCELGESVIFIKRLRLADGLPMVVENSYLNSVRCQNVLYADLNKDSLYAILREKCGLKLNYCHETIELGFCTIDAGKLLDIQPGKPVFLRTRTTYTDMGAVEYVSSQSRADRFKFSLEVRL